MPPRPRRRAGRAPGASATPAALPPEANPQLTAALLAAVEEQIVSGNPPETRATLQRLVAAGYTPEGARQLIAHAVAHEIFAVMANGQPYDRERYVAALARLPSLDQE